MPRPTVDPPAPEASVPRVFRLGVIPGATPGKWVQAWRERMPAVAVELVPLEVRDQRTALLSGELDAALVRLPLEDDGLHVIRLYDEVPVVVVSAESALTVAEQLGADDLVGEVLVVPRDDVFGAEVLSAAIPGAASPRFDPPADTGDAIATVAAGVGIVVVPMSLARLHHRKDAEHRPLRGGPTSTVALAWPAERTTPDVEAFVGIVRGRTAHSSR
ncbi:LysR substrate-binding domain-containing protein [Microbacterium sp. CJ88]|uniref:LysR substrate-binding domain-containing protein n=1 Tax=Microbacterium sp. CJ88 TaxID=3445672 RepID=UPI003F65AAE5